MIFHGSARSWGKLLSEQLIRLRTIDVETLIETRYQRLMDAGAFHAG